MLFRVKGRHSSLQPKAKTFEMSQIPDILVNLNTYWLNETSLASWIININYTILLTLRRLDAY